MGVMPGSPRVAEVVPLPFEEVIARVPFLRALARAEQERLRPYSEVRRLGQRQAVWSLDDRLLHYTFLLSGHAKLIRPCESGREVILQLAAPGELLCFGAVSAFSPACCTCVALDEDVLVVMVPRRDVLYILEQNPAAAAAFVREASSREMRLGQRIVELSSGHVEQRISGLLLRLADETGAPAANGRVKIGVKLSRQDLADLCGTTFETTVRTMTKLARDGIVHTLDRGFVVADRARLAAAARGRSSSPCPDEK